MPARTAARVLCLLGLFSIAGCGSGDSRPPSAKVSGKVTFGGQPVTEGVVNFMSPNLGTAGAGTLNAQGEYTITDGIPPGNYLVYVTPPRITKPPMAGESPPEAKEYPNIPEKARTEKSSGLSADVKAGENKGVDFKLD